jgi:hypothetical protein
MDDHSTAENPADAFSRFWADAMSRAMGAGGWQPQAPSREDAMRQMRQAFLDAWEHHCIELMSSEAFLDLMRKSMDNALLFRTQINQLVNKVMQDSPIPTKDDTDSILQVLRSIEGRVLDRLDELTQRVDAVEARVNGSPSKPSKSGGSAKRKTK